MFAYAYPTTRHTINKVCAWTMKTKLLCKITTKHLAQKRAIDSSPSFSRQQHRPLGSKGKVYFTEVVYKSTLCSQCYPWFCPFILQSRPPPNAVGLSEVLSQRSILTVLMWFSADSSRMFRNGLTCTFIRYTLTCKFGLEKSRTAERIQMP